MNKFILFFSLLLSVGVFTLNGQEDPGKAYKKAGRALAAYHLDPGVNGDKLSEAKSLIDIALNSDEIQKVAKAWQTKGEIYSTLAFQELQAYNIDNTRAFTMEDAGLQANEAFMMANKTALKGFETKEALKGLSDNIPTLSNMGIIAYKRSEGKAAFSNFQAVLDAHSLLLEGKTASPLDADGQYENAVYLAAIAATQAGMHDKSINYYEKLVEMDYKEPAVYDGLYKAYKDNNPDKAIATLEKGRQAFPDDTNLLFSEINYYLEQNELNQLLDKLKLAIEKEPDNVNLYTTLGNVYDRLFQDEMAANNESKANEYFDSAMQYYNLALEKDPKSNVATYSIGALYFNKAATLNKSAEALADDYSKAATDRYNKIKEQVNSFFDLALPFFEKAESQNPKDVNTLIALKDIYALKGDLTKSKEFEDRLNDLNGSATEE